MDIVEVKLQLPIKFLTHTKNYWGNPDVWIPADV